MWPHYPLIAAAVAAAITIGSCASDEFESNPTYKYDIHVDDADIPKIINQIEEFSSLNGGEYSISFFQKDNYNMFAISIKSDECYIVIMNPSRKNEIRIGAYISVYNQAENINTLNSRMSELILGIQRVAPGASILGGRSL